MMMTDLQAKELEILKVFIDICNRLNLTYYLVCGSALGAVKYGGFIPWDDDVDLGLGREEYEIFILEAPKLLPEYLFLQNFYTDPAFPQLFSKIRDSRTTYVEKSVAHLKMNHGVYIDVFPLDGYPLTIEEQETLEAKKLGYQKKLSCVFRLPRNLKSKIGCWGRRCLGYHKHTAEILDAYTRDVSAFSTESSHLWCNHGNWQGRLEYTPREQYGKGTMVKFEGLDVRVPEKYDEYLTQKYGDWRADLPVEKQVGHHYYKIMDLHNPYTQYIPRSKK